MRWLFLLAIAAIGWGARLLAFGVGADPAASALTALGLLMVGGVLAGELAARLRLPRITGYLVLGLLVGPHALALETAADAELLRLFEELALGLIALNAGGELEASHLAQRLRQLIAITACHTVGLSVIVATLTWLAATTLAIFGAISPTEAVVAAALVGVVAVAVSPSTTMAVINESGARGELVDTVLGVTVLKDLIVLLLFTAVDGLALAWLGDRSGGLHLVGEVAGEIVLSLLAGAVLGLLLGAFLVRVGRHAELTVVLLALVSVELGHGSPLEHILVCMAAGFTVRNLFPRVAEGFVAALERSSPPIYVVFFALVGAGLDLGVLRLVWAPALAVAGARLAATVVLTRLPARWAGAGAGVVRYAWMGFVAQAGLSLGLAARIQRELPTIGAAVATLIVAMVVFNQLFGPITWAHALRATGEATATRAPTG